MQHEMKRPRTRWMTAVLMLAFHLVCVQIRDGRMEPQPKWGVFSWNQENAKDSSAREAMLDAMVQLGISEICQEMDSASAPSFLQRANELGLDVFLLAGRPEWGLQRNGKNMIAQVDRAAAMVSEWGDAGPRGLVLDVESYLTDEYQRNPKAAMNRFLDALRKTYARA